MNQLESRIVWTTISNKRVDLWSSIFYGINRCNKGPHSLQLVMIWHVWAWPKECQIRYQFCLKRGMSWVMKLVFYMWFCKFIQPFQVVMVSMPKVIQHDWTNVPLRLAIERQKFVTFLRVSCMKTWTGKNVNYVEYKVAKRLRLLLRLF